MARRARGWSKAQRTAAGERMRKFWAEKKAKKKNGKPRTLPENYGHVHLARQQIKRANGRTVDVDAVPPPILLSLTIATRDDLINFITLLEREDWRIAEMRIARAI